jgi:carbon-monoxide dehydrogenase large subunit
VALLTPILHGQTHGGIAQGVGQALLENSYYEPQSGQLLAASFMDYAMPRADTLPFLATALSEVPTPNNRLGVRSAECRVAASRATLLDAFFVWAQNADQPHLPT